MAEVNEHHNRAMDYAEQAQLSRLRGDTEGELTLVRRALFCEVLAIHSLDSPEDEPTFGVLHRSAATLALRCGELDLAAMLATYGLAGMTAHVFPNKPPEELVTELTDIIKKAMGEV